LDHIIKPEEKKNQKKTFSHTILEIGAEEKEFSEKKPNKFKRNHEVVRADSNTTGSSATPSRSEETPQHREWNVETEVRAVAARNRAGAARRGLTDRIGQRWGV